MMELNYLQNKYKQIKKENYKISDFHDLILSDGNLENNRWFYAIGASIENTHDYIPGPPDC